MSYSPRKVIAIYEGVLRVEAMERAAIVNDIAIATQGSKKMINDHIKALREQI